MDNTSFANEDIEIRAVGRVRVVRFTRPDMRNPLSLGVLDGLYGLLEDLDGVERLIFTGTDEVFASGANLTEIANVGPEKAREFARHGQVLMSRISELDIETIAAINGFCFGGALDLAQACDRRVASPEDSFAHPGAGLGIITGWGGTQRLPRLVGTANALEMFFTAAPIDADRALHIGLIDSVHPDPLAVALGDSRDEEI